MDIETARALCLTVKGATEETPFDDVTLVYKVMGKMFASNQALTSACLSASWFLSLLIMNRLIFMVAVF